MIPQQGTVLKRVGLPPKRLIPFRCVTPFKKISATFKAPDGVTHKVEVLADGQQFVAEGIHETTQQPYRWADNVSLLMLRTSSCRWLTKRWLAASSPRRAKS